MKEKGTREELEEKEARMKQVGDEAGFRVAESGNGKGMDWLSVRSRRPLALFDLAGAGHEDGHELAGLREQVSDSLRFD
jgi:hypothetical protein